MSKYRIIPLALVLASMLACFGSGEVKTDAAEAQLKSGDLAGAQTAYAGLAKDHPDAVNVAVGQAYMQMLAGDYEGADKTLQAVEDKAGDAAGEIKLRRALVALRSGNLDDVKKYGKESGLPAGQVLAAEVHLVDAEADDAITLLKLAKTDQGEVGATAQQYLDLLQSGGAVQTGLAEATAIWAVGQRGTACDVAEEIVKALPDGPDKADALLLWAGRAVTSGRSGIATSLLDELDLVGAPKGQEWRVQATRAMVFIAEGQDDEGLARFKALDQAITAGFAPWQGVADAKATAAALAKDKATARALLKGAEGVPAARGLYAAGAGKLARNAAPDDSVFAKFLDNK